MEQQQNILIREMDNVKKKSIEKDWRETFLNYIESQIEINSTDLSVTSDIDYDDTYMNYNSKYLYNYIMDIR